MSILSKAKKESDGVTAAFFVDQRKKRSEEHGLSRPKNQLAAVLNTLKQCNYEVESIDHLQAIISDPVKDYVDRKQAKDLNDPKHPIHMLIEAGFDPEKLKEKVKLPDGFDSLVAACRAVNVGEVPWHCFKLQNGVIEYSPRFHQKLENKVYWFATSDLQKKRLEYSNKLLALYKEHTELLIEEAKAAGVEKHHIDKALKNGYYLGPIPYSLKMEYSDHYGEVRELRVNEEWVTFGHLPWADEIGLSNLRPSKPLPKDNLTKYRKFYRTNLDGSRTLYVVVKGEEKSVYTGLREAQPEFLEGDFVIIDNKFVLTED